MTLMEIDEVAIKKTLWNAVRAGDKEALTELRKFVDGMNIYFHNLPTEEDEVLVTLRDLERHLVVESVNIEAEKERT